MMELTEDRFQCLRAVLKAGGRVDHDDPRLARFCSDASTLTHPDVFNQCHDAGWLQSWHDDRTDASCVTLTTEGMAVLTRPEQAAEAGERSMSKTERQLAALIMDADLPKRLQEEIDRLRAELVKARSGNALMEEIFHLRADLVDQTERGDKATTDCHRLRAELAEVKALHDVSLAACGTWRDAARRDAEEIARLRDAMIQVETVCSDNSGNSCKHKLALAFVREVARAALSPRPPEGNSLMAPKPVQF